MCTCWRVAALFYKVYAFWKRVLLGLLNVQFFVRIVLPQSLPQLVAMLMLVVFAVMIADRCWRAHRRICPARPCGGVYLVFALLG